jgi:hypothetical protein
MPIESELRHCINKSSADHFNFIPLTDEECGWLARILPKDFPTGSIALKFVHPKVAYYKQQMDQEPNVQFKF